MRVHELAKELGIESKELVKKLAAIKIDVKSHMSVMTDEQVAKARQGLKGIPLPAKKPAPAEKKPAAKKPAPAAAPKPAVEEKVVLIKKTPPAPPKGAELPPAAAPKPAAKPAQSPAVQTPSPEKPSVKPAPAPAAAATTTLEPAASEKTAPAAEEKILEIPFPVSVKDLAERLGIKSNILITKLMGYGVFATINQNLDEDTATIVAHEYGFSLKLLKGAVATAPAATTAGAPAPAAAAAAPAAQAFAEEDLVVEEEPDAPPSLKPRPPVVTILGHVDHGKTSLLDKIRSAKVAASESGGITQHIGAYSVKHRDHVITFLDTPGHEAFTAMRARGARVTDIAILVVASDDGIMPQTVEAIDHARAAGVPILVAINKMDLPTAAPDRVKRQLSEHDLLTEDWGGQTIAVGVSAMTGQGIDQLLEMILLQAELLELKANPNRRASGSVIESKLSSGRGSVATVLVRNGTLKVGDPVVAGLYSGRVKALVNDQGQNVREAGPSMPVELIGLAGVPEAGADFHVMPGEKEAKTMAEKRQAAQRAKALGSREKVTLEDIYRQIASGQMKSFNLIVKTDVQGSLEALQKTLLGIPADKITLRIIHAGAGDINDSDVMLAAASKAVIVGFHVRAAASVKELAKKESVDIRLYEIIYQVVDDVRKAMEGLLEPKYNEVVTGKAQVRQCFKISKVGTVAGCYVTDGVIRRNSKVRLVRAGETVHTGEIASLKRFKDEVKEVKNEFECGLRLVNFDDVREGDVIEAFTLQKEEQKL